MYRFAILREDGDDIAFRKFVGETADEDVSGVFVVCDELATARLNRRQKGPG